MSVKKICRECDFQGDESLFVKDKNWCKKCQQKYNREYNNAQRSMKRRQNFRRLMDLLNEESKDRG